MATVAEEGNVWVGFMDTVPVIGTVKEGVEWALALYEENREVVKEKERHFEWRMYEPQYPEELEEPESKFQSKPSYGVRKLHSKPMSLVEPESPEEPESPVEPESPEEPESPVEPECPEEPESPVEPEPPEEPESRVEPEPPEEPESSLKPKSPEEPESPVEPESPEEQMKRLMLPETPEGEKEDPKGASASASASVSALQDVKEVKLEELVEYVRTAPASKRKTQSREVREKEEETKKVQKIQKETLEKIRRLLPEYILSTELKRETQRARRGEHVFNNNVLKFHPRLLETVLGRPNLPERDRLARDRNKLIHDLEPQTRNDIRNNMVAAFDEREFYVNANALIYGVYCRELRSLLLEIMRNAELHNRRKERRVDEIIWLMYIQEVYVDQMAKAKWINHNRERKARFNDVKYDIRHMYKRHDYDWCRRIYHEVQKWFRLFTHDQAVM